MILDNVLKKSIRQLGHLGYISQFTTEVAHIKLSDNVVQYMPFPGNVQSPTSVSLTQIKEAYATDYENLN